MANDIENLTATAPEPPAATETPTTQPPPEAPPEVADTPAPNILARLVRAIDRAMSPRPERRGPALTMAMLIDVAGGQQTFLNEATLDKLRNWQARHDKNLAFMMNANPSADWNKHQAEIGERIEAGTADESHAVSRDEFIRSHEQKIEAARINLENIYIDSHPLCSAIADHCIGIAERQIRLRVAGERESHEFYGVPYTEPSAIVRAFKAAIEFAKVRQKFVKGSRASCRDLIGYINF